MHSEFEKIKDLIGEGEKEGQDFDAMSKEKKKVYEVNFEGKRNCKLVVGCLL